MNDQPSDALFLRQLMAEYSVAVQVCDATVDAQSVVADHQTKGPLKLSGYANKNDGRDDGFGRNT